MPSGTVVVDREGRIVLLNEAAIRILGLPPMSAVVGQPCRESLASCPDVARLLVETLATTSPANRAELELRRKAGRDRTIGYTLSVVRDSKGEIIGAAIFFKDLTAIERQEEQARLKDRLAVLGEMAAGLAHEMRNPLAAIEVHAGLLRRAVDPALTGLVESVEHILDEARRLNQAVATALDFVRPVLVVEGPVEVEPLLEAAAAEPGAGASRFVREYAPGGTTALGDAVQLRQAFDNLVRNAREAAGPSGTVWLRTRWEPAADRGPGTAGGLAPSSEGDDAEADGPQVIVEVADNGPGVAPEHRHRIFHPFFTTKPKGSGLGLALVQKIVQSHRGRIDFASTLGWGTTFRVVLRPAGRASAP